MVPKQRFQQRQGAGRKPTGKTDPKNHGKEIGNAGPDRDARRKALEGAISQIEKSFGKEAIRRLGDRTRSDVEGISTGSISLDIATGIGGIPRGRVTEIYGPEASGKTTLALQAIARVQSMGGSAALIDAEHALDPVYARNLGVNLDELLVSQPDTGEQALEIAEMLVRSNAVDIVVVDSVAALVPRAEIEGEMGDAHVGLQARLMSQALRKLTAAIGRTKTSVIFINQIRMKIGVMFGSPETTSGGRALRFYASLRLDIRRIAGIKKGDAVTGNRVRVKIAKNKVAPPFRIAEFDMIFGKGVSWAGDVLDQAERDGFVTKSGAWYSFGETRLGHGRDTAGNGTEHDNRYVQGGTRTRDRRAERLRRERRSRAVQRGQFSADPCPGRLGQVRRRLDLGSEPVSGDSGRRL